jgi:hypothetical protein
LINNRWLKTSPEELYDIAVWVAESPRIAKDGVLISIRDFLKKGVIQTSKQK